MQTMILGQLSYPLGLPGAYSPATKALEGNHRRFQVSHDRNFALALANSFTRLQFFDQNMAKGPVLYTSSKRQNLWLTHSLQHRMPAVDLRTNCGP